MEHTVNPAGPRVVDVRVEATRYGVNDEKVGYSVHPVWSAPGVELDRVIGSGWCVTSMGLVARLTRALKAMEATADPEVKTDINGHTYVSARHVVSAKRMNSDLKKLGF